jgi:glycosyltransferase involved in cell wall biosynthesis
MDEELHVAVLFNRFGPYHRARLDAAGQMMRVTGVEVVGKSSTYAWEEVETAPSFERVTLFPEADRSAVSNATLKRVMDREFGTIAPDAVAIPGWSYPRALAALRWCGRNEVPAIVMSETTESDFSRRWWAEQLKQRVVSHFGAGLVGGAPHREYLRTLGMPAETIFLGYDVVDNDYFRTGARDARNHEADKREKYELPGSYFLASCRFIPKKNLPRLIKAYGKYRRQASDDIWDLVLLGEGPERSTVERCIEDAGVEQSVHLPGFKQYDELPTYYGLAGAFVHASTREQWGLVVNEAMAAGLPVLVSDRCGCAPDLVEDGRNGFTFDPHDPSALAGLMARVAHGDVNRVDMGAASQDIIKEWGPERFATGLKKAAEAALQAGPPSSSLLDRLLINALMYR